MQIAEEDARPDPVFRPELRQQDQQEATTATDDLGDSQAPATQTQNQQHPVWQRIANMFLARQAELPLRIIFLDKSGSMGCDEVSYESLLIALDNSLNVSEQAGGTNIVFLMAGPGETELFVRT